MVANLPPRSFPLVSCRNCGHATIWPRWRKLADCEYAELCRRCFALSYLVVAMARQTALEVKR
jgi:hypothetical protein